MKIPLLGGYSKRRSVNQDAQRTVNLYLETDTAEPESGSALYMVPGKRNLPPSAMDRYGR